MSKRIHALASISTEYHGKRLALSLSDGEFEQLMAFIEENDELDKVAFASAVDRWGQGMAKKPKGLYTMHELANMANNRAHQKEKA